MCYNCTVPLFGCNRRETSYIHSHCMSLQVPVHLPTFQLSQLVPPVSEFFGLLQPLELLWWGIEYTIRQKEARTLTQTPAAWTLVLVQLNTPCLVFREAFGILSPWLPSHSITWALWLVVNYISCMPTSREGQPCSIAVWTSREGQRYSIAGRDDSVFELIERASLTP